MQSNYTGVDLTKTVLGSQTHFYGGGTTACGCTIDSGYFVEDKKLPRDWYLGATGPTFNLRYENAKTTTPTFNCNSCARNECPKGLCKGTDGTDDTCMADNWAGTGTTLKNNCAEFCYPDKGCFKLTVVGQMFEKSIQDQTAVGKSINVFIGDGTEIQNQYGVNQNWGDPVSAGLQNGCELGNNIDCEDLTCKTGQQFKMELGYWNSVDGYTTWKAKNCGTRENYKCRNAAGLPVHIDVIPKSTESGDWPKNNNMAVLIESIPCPKEIIQLRSTGCNNLCTFPAMAPLPPISPPHPPSSPPPP